MLSEDKLNAEFNLALAKTNTQVKDFADKYYIKDHPREPYPYLKTYDLIYSKKSARLIKEGRFNELAIKEYGIYTYCDNENMPRFMRNFYFYPIYDWRTEDIWGAVSKLNLKFNYIYELMYKNGVSIYEQRLCQPYGDDQKNGLDQFKALEYETWGKVLNRVNGVNFGNIYCKTTALGNIKSCKPNFMSWQEYTVFLLESIGIYNNDLMRHYYKKIKKFMMWHKTKYGIEIKDIAKVSIIFIYKILVLSRILFILFYFYQFAP